MLSEHRSSGKASGGVLVFTHLKGQMGTIFALFLKKGRDQICFQKAVFNKEMNLFRYFQPLQSYHGKWLMVTGERDAAVDLLLCQIWWWEAGREVFKCSEYQRHFLNTNVFPYCAGLVLSGFMAGPWELELAQLS